MDAQHAELGGLERKMHLMMMAGAMLQGSRIHSGMIEAYAELDQAVALTERLATISMEWPGAIEGEGRGARACDGASACYLRTLRPRVGQPFQLVLAQLQLHRR